MCTPIGIVFKNEFGTFLAQRITVSDQDGSREHTAVYSVDIQTDDCGLNKIEVVDTPAYYDIDDDIDWVCVDFTSNVAPKLFA